MWVADQLSEQCGTPGIAGSFAADSRAAHLKPKAQQEEEEPPPDSDTQILIQRRFFKMQENNNERRCAHVPCQCPAEAGSDYCSPQCEKAFDETDCNCGHPECRAKA